MKRIKIILATILGIALIVTGCQQEEHELGRPLQKSEIQIQVIQDFDTDPGGNTVILKNNTAGTVSMWDYGTGRSNRAQDTIRFAFAGEYTIKFSAVTAGGIVELDPIVIEVTADNLNYVNDPLWTALTGGVGNEKTWILDNGQYGFSPGPLSYADPARAQVWGDYQPNWEPTAGDLGLAADYEAAEMTFKLQGGPFIETVKPNEAGGNESGTFYLDVDNHTLSTTDATIIRVASFIGNADNWTNNLRILELTEDRLRVAVYRTNNEGPWWYIFNYVSKEYAENYVPGYQPDPNFNHGDQLQILAGNSLTRWKLNTETPFDWTGLDGTLINNWKSITDYADWTGYNAAAVSDIENVRLVFYRTGEVVLTSNDGSTQNGFFSLDEAKNLVTFDGFKPSIYISGGWVYATTTDYFEDAGGNVITGDNQWKIVKTTSVSGVVTDIWFGKRDTGKKEYMVYRFTLEEGVPDVKTEMIKGLCGKATGTSSRTFKIDLNWPVDWNNIDGVDWTNPGGVGWTVPGAQEGWYWNADIAASVKNQTLTFSQTDGVVTVTKKDANGVISSSPVEIDPENRMIIINDIDIIQFGAGSWLPTSGPNYIWARGDFHRVEEDGFWLGVQSKPEEITAYHYILK